MSLHRVRMFICPACDLFGHVGETGQGSKIRFSDLYVEEKKDAVDYYACDKITLRSIGRTKTWKHRFLSDKACRECHILDV